MNRNKKIPPTEMPARAERGGHTPADLARDIGEKATTFHGIQRNNYPLLRQLESGVFANEFKCFSRGGLKELLKEEGADKFSFIIKSQEDGRDVGYCVASYGYSPDEETDRSSIFVTSFALSQEYQRKGLGMQGFLELLRRAEEDGGITSIEFYLRDTTSYPAIISNEKLLAEKGYRIVDNGIAPDFYEIDKETGSFGTESEPLHHIVLSKKSTNRPSLFIV